MVGIDFQIITRLLAVSATARIVPSVATAVGKRRPVCEMRKSVLAKSGWPSTTLAFPEAHRAARDKRPDRIERPGKGLGGKQQDPVVHRRQAGAVGIRHEQDAIRIGHAAHRAQQSIRRARLLVGEGALPDNQARALAGDEIGGQAHTGTQ